MSPEAGEPPEATSDAGAQPRLKKSDLRFEQTRSFLTKDGAPIQGVVIVGGDGEHLVVFETRSIDEVLLQALLVQQKITNLHLASMSNEEFTEEDIS